MVKMPDQLGEAEAVYRTILTRDPRCFEALHVLGMASFQRGHMADAHRLLAQAVDVNPRSPEALSLLSAVLMSLDRPTEALALCDDILVLVPGDPQTTYNRALVLRRLGRVEEAIAGYDRVLGRQPDFVPALFDKGNALAQLDRSDEALACYGKVLSIVPEHVDALNNRGNVCAKLGRLADALATYDKVLCIRPDHLDALANRGATLNRLGREEEALACYQRVLAIDPRHVNASFNRGNALLKLHRPAEALASYQQALASAPDNIDAAIGYGTALIKLDRRDEALAVFERALASDAGNVELMNKRADLFAMERRFEAGLRAYEDILAIEPDNADALAGVVNCLLETCWWEPLRDPIDRITALVEDGQSVAPLLYIRAVDDPESHAACAGNFMRAAIPVMPQPLAARPAVGAGRIRIAYLSPDFRIHPVGFLLPELLERHDRAHFEVIAVSYGPNDGSDIRARLVGSVDQFHDVVARSDREVAQLVHGLEVDIAVDLAGHTEHARPRVLALRPAPIQVSYLGYCGTVGAPFIDYIMADRTVLPRDQQRHFCEQIVHLPDCFLVNDSKQDMSAGASSRGAAGLPDDGFVFCCFNKSYKIMPAVFDVWMRLLRQVDGSVLWLTKNNDLATENLRARAARRGVDPGRVIFAPSVPRRADHLARQRLADLFLDTLPYNAHTTACDALFAGLPVLTCPGKAFAGRVAASLLHAAGLPELAVSTLDEYEALALELATDESRMQAIRRKLADNRATCPLFDADRFRRHIEAAYATMWDIWRRGEKPRSFSVDSV